MQIQLKKPFGYIAVFGTIILLISLISGLIMYALETLFHFQINLNNKFAHLPFTTKLIAGSLIAQIIETYLFQQLPFTFLKKWKTNYTIILIISGFLFGLSHSYSIAYMIITFFAGITLMYAFINWHGNLNSKYLITAAIHRVANTCVTMLYLFFS